MKNIYWRATQGGQHYSGEKLASSKHEVIIELRREGLMPIQIDKWVEVEDSLPEKPLAEKWSVAMVSFGVGLLLFIVGIVGMIFFSYKFMYLSTALFLFGIIFGCDTAKERNSSKSDRIELFLKRMIIYVCLMVGLGFFLESNFSKEAKAEAEARNSRNEKDQESRGDIHGAWASMQMFVEQRLKSPNSAEFPFGGSRSVKYLGGDRYQIDSYVDSLNSFGVSIRTHFSGVLEKSGDRWRLESLNMQ